jgi:hypothetical protein
VKGLKQVALAAAILAVVVGAVSLFETYVLRATPGRCVNLSKIEEALDAGMTRAEVESQIQRRQAPFIRRNEQGQTLTLWAYTGRLSACKLVVEFTDDRLVRSHSGRDGW